MSRVVARGAIRVDARRAVEKLRDHLLVDLSLYLLELVRAAVAGGATLLDARCDADDVILTFDGAPLPAATLTRLLDHVLDAPQGAEARRIRLLALGVNAALGLRPTRVDVLSTRGAPAGRCVRVRFTPSVLEAPGAEGGAAEAPACDEAPRPAGMPADGMRVEVRRRLGWSVLRRAIAGGLPPEIAHLAAATGDLPTPVTLGGEPLRDAIPQSAPVAPLLRVPFQVRGARRAALEVLPAPERAAAAQEDGASRPRGPLAAAGLPVVDYLEHGVLLLREAWTFGGRAPGASPGLPDAARWFPSAPFQGVELPVRLVVDAEALPTNASRSALREDAPLLASLREAALAALLEALRALRALVLGAREVPEGVLVLDRDPRRLEDALAAVACVVTGAARAGLALPDAALAARDLPLLCDGLGRPISPASLDGRGARPVYLWQGKAPLPEEMGPWVGDVVWARGRLIERVLAGLPLADAAEMVEQARTGAERRKAFLAHARGAPVVPPSPEHALRATFDVREGAHAGLRGEIAVLADDGKPRRRAAVRVFVEGRHLETVELDPGAVPLPLEIALSWEGRVRPRFTYEGVERDAAFAQAVWYALRVAILAADEEARRLFGRAPARGAQSEPPRASDPPPAGPAAHPPEPPAAREEQARLRAPLRAALGTLLCAPAAFGIDASRHSGAGSGAEGGRPSDMAPSAFEGLYSARIWPTTEPERFESLRSLTRLAARARGLCVAPPWAQGRAADGRSVLALPQVELDWIGAAIPGRELVPYAQALWTPEALAGRGEARRRLLAAALEQIARPAPLSAAPVLEVRRGAMYALATPSDVAVEAWYHASRPLVRIPGTPQLGSLAVAIDDDTITPDKGWGAMLAGPGTAALRSIERELCEALAAALEGDPGARSRLGPAVEPGASTRVTAYLLDSARAVERRARKAPPDSPDATLWARLRRLPLLAMLDARGEPSPCSLAAIEEAHPPPEPIPFLEELPGFETLGWRPVLVRDARERAALTRWAGGRALASAAALPERRRMAADEVERRAFFAGPEHDPRALGDLADPEPRFVFIHTESADVVPNTQRFGWLSAARGGPPAEASASISVAAALPRANAAAAAGTYAWVDVLFCRRALCRRALPSLPIPVVARVGLSDPRHIAAWRDLSPEGLEQVTGRVRAAAIALAARLVAEAASVPGANAALFGDLRALALVAALLSAAASRAGGAADAGVEALAASLRDQRLRWPTAQGEEHPLGRVQVLGGEQCVASRRFVPWRKGPRSSDLDAPVLLVPESPAGEHVRVILAAFGWKVRDVTAALAALQARRAGEGPAEAPRLPGDPAHPLLRVSLASQGIDAAEGELEIIEGPASDIALVGLDGVPRAVPAEIPIPLRVLARVDSADTSKPADYAILKSIARAAGRYLITLAPRFDELPPFVRAHMRRAVCKTVADGKRVTAKAAKAPLFCDIRGAWYALDALRADPAAEWACTHGPPPYPKRRYLSPVLCLTDAERAALSTILPIKNLTAVLTRDRAGEERAAAPPLPVIALSAEERARCVRVFRFRDPAPPAATAAGPPDEGEAAPAEALAAAETQAPAEPAPAPAFGEVGLLAPEHAGDAGIVVHVGRRRVCELHLEEGWPVRAVINDDTLQPNRYFDGLRTSASAARVRSRVRDAVAAWLRATRTPPEGALAARWVDIALTPKRPLLVAGAFWLPTKWPRDPRVLVTAKGPAGDDMRGAFVRALTVQFGAKHVSGLVPVEGSILVSPPDGRWGEVADAAMRACASMVAEAARRLPGDPEIAAYQWNLRLLGRLEGGAPCAATADGREVGPSQVLNELALRGHIWCTRRDGSAEGDFPEGAPEVVLLDGASPLMEVLRHRAQPGVLRELGARQDEPAALRDVGAEPGGVLVGWDEAPPMSGPQPGLPPGVPVATDAAGEPAGPAASDETSWMSELWRTIRSFFGIADGAGPAVPAPGVGEGALAAALGAVLAELGLSGQPVSQVVESRTGRPIRYDPRRRLLVVNPGHRSLVWLRGPPDAGATALLAAAAVGEINRALRSVTDAEERRALDHLLRSME